jgi:hypothetical protein
MYTVHCTLYTVQCTVYGYIIPYKILKMLEFFYTKLNLSIKWNSFRVGGSESGKTWKVGPDPDKTITDPQHCSIPKPLVTRIEKVTYWKIKLTA